MEIFGTTDSFVETPERDLKLGRLVANSEFFRALVKHGSFDAYHVFCASQTHVALLKDYLEREVSDPAILSRIQLFHQLQLIDQLRDQRYSVFHVGGWYHYLIRLAYLRARFVATPLPLSGVIHSLNTPEVPQKCRELLEAPLATGDAIVCTSESGRRVLQNQLAHAAQHVETEACELRAQLAQIPFGVDEAFFQVREPSHCRSALGLAPEAVVLLYLGRLSTANKADLAPLLYVFRNLVQRAAVPLCLVLAGGAEPSTRRRLEDLIGKLGLLNQVKLAPDIDRATKLDLYAAADVFVSPIDNLQETFGISIVEAMAMGLPVVAAELDGYRELVQNGESGFLTPTLWAEPPRLVSELGALLEPRVSQGLVAQSLAVDPHALEKQLEQLIAHPQLRRSQGECGRRIAEQRFRWSTVIAQYEELWRELRTLGGAGTSHTLPDPSAVDLFQVFSHYPSERLHDGHAFELSQLGSECVHGKQEWPEWHDDGALLADPSILFWLAEKLEADALAWGELRLEAPAQGFAEDLVRLHLAWMHKYGLLRRI